MCSNRFEKRWVEQGYACSRKKSYHKKLTRAFHMVIVFNLVIVKQGYAACPKFP